MARFANRPAATAALVVLSIVALALPAAAANVVLVNLDPPRGRPERPDPRGSGRRQPGRDPG